MNPPVEAPASRQRRRAHDEPGRLEDVERPGQLVAPARDVVGAVGVVGHHDRDVGGHPGRRLGRDRAPTPSPVPRPPARPRARASAPARDGPARRPGAAAVAARSGRAAGRRGRARSSACALLEDRHLLGQRRSPTAATASSTASTRSTPVRVGSLHGDVVVEPVGASVMAPRLPVSRRRAARRPPCRRPRPVLVEVRPSPPRPRRATSRPAAPSPVDDERRRRRPAPPPAQRPARRPSRSRRRLRLAAAPAGRARRTSAAPPGVAATSSASPVTPVSTSSESIPTLRAALDVGVEPVAHHQRALAADPAHRLVEQRARRLAGHDRLDLGEAAQRVDQHAVAGRHAVRRRDRPVGVARHPPQAVADPHGGAHDVAPTRTSRPVAGDTTASASSSTPTGDQPALGAAPPQARRRPAATTRAPSPSRSSSTPAAAWAEVTTSDRRPAPRASRRCSATASGGREALLVMKATRMPGSRAPRRGARRHPAPRRAPT